MDGHGTRTGEDQPTLPPYSSNHSVCMVKAPMRWILAFPVLWWWKIFLAERIYGLNFFACEFSPLVLWNRLLGFRSWVTVVILIITVFFFFYISHRLVLCKPENTTFRKLDLFLSSGEGGDTYSVGSLRKSSHQRTDDGKSPKTQ
jgi:hypothetical protein